MTNAEQTGRPPHKTIPVQVWADVDEKIAWMVRYLNMIPGVRTHASCQGTIGEGGPSPYRAQVMATWPADASERLGKEFDITLEGENWGYLHPREGTSLPAEQTGTSAQMLELVVHLRESATEPGTPISDKFDEVACEEPGGCCEWPECGCRRKNLHGTFACPICGEDTPHHHSTEVEKRTECNGCMNPACEDCFDHDPGPDALRRTAASQDARPGTDAAALVDTLSDLVSRFSNALLAKLRLAQANGRSGWERDDWEKDCQEGLFKHLAKGDPRDVAAYCAFMWHHGWITQPTTLAVPQSAPAVTAPHNSGERLPNGDTAEVGADAVALAAIDDAAMAIQGILEHPSDEDAWYDARAVLSKLQAFLEAPQPQAGADGKTIGEFYGDPRAQPQAGVSEPVDITGWKLVPDDPTEAMWQAGRNADIHPGDSYSKVWRAMFDAAPNVDDCETTNATPSPTAAGRK